eukprot:jgi/Mesvir1/16536/Mv10080-RA.1
MAAPGPIFGVVFPGSSFLLDSTRFTPVDAQHFRLDLAPYVGFAFDQIKDLCIFLLSDQVLPPEFALAVYVQAPGTEWQYRGFIANGKPSASIPLRWPIPSADVPQHMGSAQIGISLEPVQQVAAMEISGPDPVREAFAKQVALDLFRYMESFAVPGGDHLMVPTNIIDRWFIKFQVIYWLQAGWLPVWLQAQGLV